MSGQRKRIQALAGEVAAWRKEFDEASSQKSREKAKEVHNRLCDTLVACNAWLEEYEGLYSLKNNVERGPIPVSWMKIP